MTPNGDYTDEQIYQILDKMLTKVCNLHNSTPDNTVLSQDANGCFEIKIDGKQTYWFANELELAQWTMGVVNEN